MNSRIGIFGGTFDPPHLGHLILAEAARAQLHLERLLWVLTPNPPHKPNLRITPTEDRLELLLAAIGADPDFELSRIEMDRPAPHYAVDTVKLLARQHPGAELIYLMGGDSLRDLPTWHRPSDFVDACSSLGVMRRPGDSIDLAALEVILPGIATKVRFVDTPLVEISSREIRQCIAEGRPFRYCLPAGVYEYIIKNRLYASGSMNK